MYLKLSRYLKQHIPEVVYSICGIAEVEGSYGDKRAIDEGLATLLVSAGPTSRRL